MKLISISPEEQLQEIALGCSEIIPENELLEKLQVSYKEQKPLTVKFGADPSQPDIHLGHTVVIQKLRIFQNFGHKIKFIIGDFTAQIGDPTGKNKTRPQLTKEAVLHNAQTYKDQVFKILDPQKTDIVYNSHWLDALSPIAFIELLAKKTVQQLLVRDDFSKRMESQNPIFLHELVYPILQAYDSYHLKADVEFGGTDQRFNLLLGRELQKQMHQRPQTVILLPLLEGLDGEQKMSKSLNNYISLNDTAQNMFGKTMSISDTHMLRFYELLSRKGVHYIETLKKDLQAGKKHPMDAKKDIAEEIAAHYWGEEQARKERLAFEERFSQKKVPVDIPSHTLQLDPSGVVNVIALSVELLFTGSKSDARRVLKQNGIKLDDQTLQEENISLEKNRTYILKYGKLKIVRLKT